MESPNLEFEYGDTDTLTAELSGKIDRSQKQSTLVTNACVYCDQASAEHFLESVCMKAKMLTLVLK